MEIEQKILQAQKYAKRIEQIKNVKFDVKTGNTKGVTFLNEVILETDTESEARDIVERMETISVPVKDELINTLRNRITDILNA